MRLIQVGERPTHNDLIHFDVLNGEAPGLFYRSAAQFVVVLDGVVVETWPNDSAGRNAMTVAMFKGIERGQEVYEKRAA